MSNGQTCFCYEAVPYGSGGVQLKMIAIEGDFFVTEADKQYSLSFSDGTHLHVSASVDLTRGGPPPDRQFFTKHAYATIEMILRLSEFSNRVSLPAIVSTDRIAVRLRSKKVRAKLNYLRITEDPGFIGARAAVASIDRLLGKSPQAPLFPEFEPSVQFEVGDYLAVVLGDGLAHKLTPNAVARIDAIDSKGFTELTMFTWDEAIEVSVGAELYRAHQWKEMSPLDIELHPRALIALLGCVIEDNSAIR
jgi:hypothetical protein